MRSCARLVFGFLRLLDQLFRADQHGNASTSASTARPPTKRASATTADRPDRNLRGKDHDRMAAQVDRRQCENDRQQGCDRYGTQREPRLPRVQRIDPEPEQEQRRDNATSDRRPVARTAHATTSRRALEHSSLMRQDAGNREHQRQPAAAGSAATMAELATARIAPISMARNGHATREQLTSSAQQRGLAGGCEAPRGAYAPASIPLRRPRRFCRLPDGCSTGGSTSRSAEHAPGRAVALLAAAARLVIVESWPCGAVHACAHAPDPFEKRLTARTCASTGVFPSAAARALPDCG